MGMRRTAHEKIGQKFGRLLVLGTFYEKSGNGRFYPWARCRCDCGKEKDIRLENMIKENGSTSCGCAHREMLVKRNLKHGCSRRGHTAKEYRIWASMIQRCTNEKISSYSDYGARGIRVCDRWAEFGNFLSDMGKAPGAHYTLERIDVDGDYEPSNCKWIPRRLQGGNTRRTRWIEHGGLRMCKQDWCFRFRISTSVLDRLIKKYGEQEAIRLLGEHGNTGPI